MGVPNSNEIDSILSLVQLRDYYTSDTNAAFLDELNTTYNKFLEKLRYAELKEFVVSAPKSDYYKKSSAETKSFMLFIPTRWIILRHHTRALSAKALLALLSGDEPITSLFGIFIERHRDELLESLFTKGHSEVSKEVSERIRKETDGERAGMYDKRLSEVIIGLQEKKGFDFMLPYRIGIFREIQEERRADANRLPLPPSTVDEVIFIVEEAARESYGYETPNFKKAANYLRIVLDWYYDRPKVVNAAAFEHAIEIDLLIDDELSALSRYLGRGMVKDQETARRLWKQANMLLDNKHLIEKLKVLNDETSYAGSVLQRDKESIKQGRMVSGVIAVAVPTILVTGGRVLPLLARATGLFARGTAKQITAGAALTTTAAQHIVIAVTTSRTVMEAVKYLGNTAWVFYLTRAPQINQTVSNGMEMALDMTGNETGVYSLSLDDVVHVAHQKADDVYEALKLEIKGEGGVSAAVKEVKQISREVFEGDFDKGKKLFVEKAGKTADTALAKTGRDVKPGTMGDLGSAQNKLTHSGRPNDAARGIDFPHDKGVVAPDAPKAKSHKKSPSSPPPSLPPPNIRDRIPDGTWLQDGKVQINDGVFEFTASKKKKTEALLYWETYQEGVQSQIVVPMAKKLSNKPVRGDRPGTKGYGSRSSAKTNRLKYQKTRKGDLLTRTPEATMEVVERTGKGAETVQEVHFFEATLQTDFKGTTGYAGHKQRQISGTLWLSTEIKRKGYTPDTKLYYHIAAPAAPSKSTIDFLNKIMDEMPNVTISWYVIK